MTFWNILFLTFSTVFLAEMGDKTQLLLVAMAGKYKIRQILTGTWLATALLSLLAVAIGAALSSYIDLRIIKSIAAAAFFWFAWSNLRGEDDEEEKERSVGKFGPVAAIFLTFFIGELGDKTQLTGVTLAASYTDGAFVNAAAIFLGCALGLILADALGLVAGLLLRNNLPTSVLRRLSFAIFAVFGVLNAHEAAGLIFPTRPFPAALVTSAATLLFAAVCFVTVLPRQK
ncbi:MAG: TMEM165/GDT1 family protein [Oscillospiraceae bacterium]|nr:TMEM165/GDT1 family protein [Oscillospiraceae bacterium]